MKVSFYINTNGKGLYTKKAARVHVTKIVLNDLDDDDPNDLHGELHVYTDFKEIDGIIYTDPQWQKEFRDYLKIVGAPAKHVGYSEAGMQGDDYVSLDVDHTFLSSKFGQQLVREFNRC